MSLSSLIETATRAASVAGTFSRKRLAPAATILIGIFAGVMVAVVVRSFLVPITNGLIAVVHFMADVLKSILPVALHDKVADLKPIVDEAPGFDYGVGAFGAVFLLTKIQDIVATLSELLGKWKSADLNLLTKSFVGLVVGFAALGLSVYGLTKLADPTSGPTFAFDALSVPLNQVQKDTGHVTFYIGFQEEGGLATFTKDSHESVTVSDSDRTFLSKLQEALAVCGAKTRVEVELHGFASGSPWTTVEAGLENLRSDVRPVVNRPQSCDPAATGRSAFESALACIADYKKNEPADERTGDALEAGKAFNVYLANRRRAAVAGLLGLAEGSTPAIKLSGEAWRNHADMQEAMAIDDSRASGTFKVKGILTRSVALTITDPGACSTSHVSRVAHTSVTLR